MSHMRGLTNFISEIRGCKNKAMETKRVLRELSNIRSKFQKNSRLDAYSRRKYTWKIIYIYMLGYNVDIGHVQAMQLIAAKSYAEKKTGYCACQVLFNENHPLLTMLTAPVKNDISSDTPEHIQALAMSLIANIGSRQMADALWKDIANLLTNGTSRSSIRKKACLCMLKMIRKAPENIEVKSVAPRVISMIADQDYGVALCAVTLMIGLISLSPNPAYNEAMPKTISLLYKLVTKQSSSGSDFSGYYYFSTVSPWLQMKCLRLLQYFPAPTGDSKKRLDESLVRILKREATRMKSGSLSSQKKNKTNADHGILFECMNLIIYYEQAPRTGEEKSNYKDHLDSMTKLLGRFISLKEANVRYLGLDTMTRLAKTEGMAQKISEQMTTILFSLRKDQDASIRKRALDLLFVICSKENSRKVTQELLSFLKVADYKIREELVLKIAILAERFATDLRWYLDVILKLITMAGDYVSDDIWYRAIQIVINNDKLQKYAALTMFHALEDDSLHENGVKVGSYVIGEFSDLIADKGGDNLFSTIHKHFETASSRTKALLLSCYIKLCNSYEELTPKVKRVLERYTVHADEELQQRACEYKQIIASDRKLLEDVFELMPAFENAKDLQTRLKVRNKKVTVSADEVDDDDEDEEKDDDDADEDGDEDEDEELDFPDQDDEAFKEILKAGKSGYLYKSGSLQIGAKMIAGIGHEMKMKIFYGNKTSYAFNNLKVSFNAPPGVLIMESPSEPFTVDAKEQKHQFLKVVCERPFSAAPEMIVNFSVGEEEESITMKLPVLVHQFISPYECNAAKFKENWGKLTSEAREVVALKGIDGQTLLSVVADVFHMHKVDMEAAATPLVGVFNAFPNGKAVKMPIMASVQVKGNQCQVIVRARHSSVADSALEAFKIMFT